MTETAGTSAIPMSSVLSGKPMKSITSPRATRTLISLAARAPGPQGWHDMSMARPVHTPEPAPPGAVPASPPAGWTFLTNHGHALVVLARDGDLRLRDLAAAIGVTERTTQSVVNDLVAAGYIDRARVGNRSRYTVHPDLPFRHPVERDHSVGELLAVLGPATAVD